MHHFDSVSDMGIEITLSEELDSKLGQIAEDRKVSKQLALDELIDDAYERMNRKKLLDDAFTTVMTRDAELMKRLADS